MIIAVLCTAELLNGETPAASRIGGCTLNATRRHSASVGIMRLARIPRSTQAVMWRIRCAALDE
jgi:hypothetical protein